jgi:hypothetical protein
MLLEYMRENGLSAISSAIKTILALYLQDLGYGNFDSLIRHILNNARATRPSLSVRKGCEGGLAINVMIPLPLYNELIKFKEDFGMSSISTTVRYIIASFFSRHREYVIKTGLEGIKISSTTRFIKDPASAIAELLVNEISNNPQYYLMNVRSKEPIYKFTTKAFRAVIARVMGKRADELSLNIHFINALRTALMERGYDIRIERRNKPVILIYPIQKKN